VGSVYLKQKKNIPIPILGNNMLQSCKCTMYQAMFSGKSEISDMEGKKSLFYICFSMISQCAGPNVQSSSTLNKGEEDQGNTPLTDNYDIASYRFKSIVDKNISNMTVTKKEICETEHRTRQQNQYQLWFDKQRSLLTTSTFGKASTM